MIIKNFITFKDTSKVALITSKVVNIC